MDRVGLLANTDTNEKESTAFLLSILCDSQHAEALREMGYSETSTLAFDTPMSNGMLSSVRSEL